MLYLEISVVCILGGFLERKWLYAPASPRLHGRSSLTPRQVWLILVGHCSFPLGPGVHKVLFVPSKSLCFAESCGSSVIKSHCPGSDSVGVPCPFAGSSGWKVWCGAWKLCNSAMPSLASLFSSLWVAHLAGMGFDFHVIAPLLLVAFPLSLAPGCSFFGGLQHPPVNGGSAARCVFGALAGDDEHMSYSYRCDYRRGLFFGHVLFN